ncbi:hypothetical protein NKF26_13175 [Haladaptatus sp. AB618]|uniref:hypothetical protein n=1 Tax=Haladaptatus sp. AB618 TaxID=2934173 RepID=UPI00209BF696|nr:hypothetical protein [Haladaptatus sp. AB618]MCO8254752.1 hypothetical protein [Haladaptatus sp. AB618]
MVRTVSDWFPDRSPTWGEITIVLFSSFGTVTSLFDLGTISWWWVAAGFVLTGTAAGPAGTTTVGKRFGQWFRDIGVTGRASAIILFAVVVWGTRFTVDVPVVGVESFVAGMWVALILYLLAYIVKTREIDGWRTG